MLIAVGVTRGREAARALLDSRRSSGDERPTFTLPAPPTVDEAGLRAAAGAVLAGKKLTTARRACVEDTLAALAEGDWRGFRRIQRTGYGGFHGEAHQVYNDSVDRATGALRDREARPVLEAFLAFFEAFRDAYARRKVERGALDFEDLQLRARNVLRDHDDVRAAYAFDRVYVDEAQDVNPLQDELVRLLSGSGGRTLRVGDAAQAIYRFRWADVACFTSAGERSRRFPLRENYRSDEPLLAVLNGWFEAVFRDGATPFTALVARAGRGDGTSSPAELVLIESDAPANRAREAEAAEVARIVRRMHDEDGIALGEIAVLFLSLIHI